MCLTCAFQRVSWTDKDRGGSQELLGVEVRKPHANAFHTDLAAFRQDDSCSQLQGGVPLQTEMQAQLQQVGLWQLAAADQIASATRGPPSVLG